VFKSCSITDVWRDREVVRKQLDHINVVFLCADRRVDAGQSAQLARRLGMDRYSSSLLPPPALLRRCSLAAFSWAAPQLRTIRGVSRLRCAPCRQSLARTRSSRPTLKKQALDTRIPVQPAACRAA
jgi:hypothetical protein